MRHRVDFRGSEQWPPRQDEIIIRAYVNDKFILNQCSVLLPSQITSRRRPCSCSDCCVYTLSLKKESVQDAKKEQRQAPHTAHNRKRNTRSHRAGRSAPSRKRVNIYYFFGYGKTRPEWAVLPFITIQDKDSKTSTPPFPPPSSRGWALPSTVGGQGSKIIYRVNLWGLRMRFILPPPQRSYEQDHNPAKQHILFPVPRALTNYISRHISRNSCPSVPKTLRNRSS